MTGGAPITIRKAAAGIDVPAWARALADFKPASAGALKTHGPGGVWRTTILARDVIIKQHDLRGTWDRVKSRLGRSRLCRQWRGAELLTRAGIATGQPILLATRGNAQPSDWLVLAHVEGRTALELLNDPALERDAERDALVAVMALTGGVRRSHLFNRDHKPSNIVMVTHPGGSGAALIDTVGIRRAPGHLDAVTARMLASLVIEPSGCGCAPRTALRMRALRELGMDRRQRREMWARVAAIVNAHRDPRPKDDPLA